MGTGQISSQVAIGNSLSCYYHLLGGQEGSVLLGSWSIAWHQSSILGYAERTQSATIVDVGRTFLLPRLIPLCAPPDPQWPKAQMAGL